MRAAAGRLPAWRAAASTAMAPSQRPPDATGPLSDVGPHRTAGLRWRHGVARPPRVSARLLRRGRAGGRDGRARARALRPARLRAQADRAQHPRRPGPRGARRHLRRVGGRGAGRRDDRLLRARRRAVRARGVGGAVAQRDRRDVPARHEGARAGPPVRRGRLHRRPDRSRRPRRGDRHDGRGAGVDRARAGRGRGGGARAAGGREGRLHHPDDAVGRRDGRDHRRPAPAVPADPRAEEGGHLLRDLQPAVGGEGDAGRGRPPARDRLAQLVELEPARRRRPCGRRRGASDRRRVRDRRGVARRGDDGGRHLGRVGSGEARVGRLRLVPRRAASSRSSRSG